MTPSTPTFRVSPPPMPGRGRHAHGERPPPCYISLGRTWSRCSTTSLTPSSDTAGSPGRYPTRLYGRPSTSQVRLIPTHSPLPPMPRDATPWLSTHTGRLTRRRQVTPPLALTT